MRSRGTRARLLSLVLPLLALSACDGDGGSGPDRLTPQEVGGIYQVCSLVFTPSGGSPPPLDIRAATMETSAGGAVRNLTLGRTVTDFALEYTRRGDVLTRRFEGSYSTGRSRVSLDFASGAGIRDALLLPEVLNLVFTAGTQPRLEIDAVHGFHTVSRVDYERLAGQSFPNARDQITGALTGSFSLGSCP